MRMKMKIAWGLNAIVMAVLLSSCAAPVVPQDGDDGESASELGVAAQELSGRFCRSDSDCPQPGAPCTECSDGSVACPEVDCVRRRCVYSFPQCPPPYDPCADKACGDLCTICDPADPDCVETAVVKLCQPDGGCSPNVPICELQPNPCAVTLCPKGTTCVVSDTDPSQATCVPAEPKVACGGFLGTPCPGAGQCVDDPSDDCDPRNGGADCSGMCVCDAIGLCRFPGHFDQSPAVCNCVGGGGSCGDNTCGPNQFCCNASCGICAPLGGACTQVFCEDAPPQ
jgi:hypothetical protein